MPPSIRKTQLYAAAMEFAIAIDEFVEELPSYRSYLKVQLRRAALSVLLNLGEGGGDFPPGEKARFYRYAKRSAIECGVALDFVCRVVPRLRERAVRLDATATALASQLHRLATSHERRRPLHSTQGGGPATSARTRRLPQPRRRSERDPL